MKARFSQRGRIRKETKKVAHEIRCKLVRVTLRDMDDDEAFVALRLELARARRKFPISEHLLPALMEEVGELAQSLLQRGNDSHTYAEAIQVACVALRIAVEGAPEFDNLPARIRKK